MKRIFTKVFSGTVGAISAGTIPHNAIESWLVQEDIEVIGAEIALVNSAPSENDGFAHCAIELSQVGIFSQDGIILKGVASEGWNTVPQGLAQTNANVAVTFPDGLAVPIKEEGYLYVNAVTYGKTAGESVFSYAIIAYYTKKGSR